MSIPAEHPFHFDPSYGLDLASLQTLTPPPGPPDFDAFWQARYSRALAVEAQIVRRPSQTHDPRWIVEDIVYVSTDGFEIGGWLLLPAGGVVQRGLVVGHGYGGRDRPDFDLPVEDTAILFPCLRGISRSAVQTIRADAGGHVIHQIEDRDRYILGGCVEDVWVGVSVLTRLFPQVAGRIGYSGISFGGGIGALALAFDKRIARGHLIVPTFGNAPLWLSLPTIGSGNSVQNYLRDHPEAAETMRYFDAAVAASRIDAPMLMAVALFDPAVAPPCQFSIENSLRPSIPHETVVLDCGHFDYPESAPQHEALHERVRAFFAAL
jgi:cephalosporin-C deacetylase